MHRARRLYPRSRGGRRRGATMDLRLSSSRGWIAGRPRCRGSGSDVAIASPTLRPTPTRNWNLSTPCHRSAPCSCRSTTACRLTSSDTSSITAAQQSCARPPNTWMQSTVFDPRSAASVISWPSSILERAGWTTNPWSPMGRPRFGGRPSTSGIPIPSTTQAARRRGRRASSSRTGMPG